MGIGETTITRKTSACQISAEGHVFSQKTPDVNTTPKSKYPRKPDCPWYDEQIKKHLILHVYI